MSKPDPASRASVAIDTGTPSFPVRPSMLTPHRFLLSQPVEGLGPIARKVPGVVIS